MSAEYNAVIVEFALGIGPISAVKDAKGLDTLILQGRHESHLECAEAIVTDLIVILVVSSHVAIFLVEVLDVKHILLP